MANMVEETEEKLRAIGAFESDMGEFAGKIRSAAKLVKEKIAESKNVEEALDNPSGDEETIMELLMTMDAIPAANIGLMDAMLTGNFTKVAERLNDMAEQVEKGEVSKEVLSVMSQHIHMDIAPLWARLGSICRRLEALAHKELRGVPFSSEENGFIKGYGEQIAGVMLYGGNSYVNPRDDAPQIVQVFYNPSIGRGLQVGIARPRAIYVLYPVRDGQILCRGAAMTYYEFQHPTSMTDAEWKEMLDSDNRPDIAEWAKPIVGRGGISGPEMREDN